MRYILYALTMIADIVVIIFLIIFEQYLLQVALMHTFLIFISWRIYKTFDNEIESVPYFILLWMPILGIVIFHSLNGSLRYFVRNGDVINDYEQMISEKHITMRRRINFANEIKTMSFLDKFPGIDSDKKKELLIDSQFSFEINNAKILAKGLESEDREVQHYSATLLNSQENEYTNNISYLRDQYAISESDTILDELLLSYYDYINSSLIGEESIYIFKKEYVDLLLTKVNKKTYDLESLHNLFNAFIEIDDYYNATLINNKIEEEFGKNSTSILHKLHILFKKGYINQLLDVLNTLSPEQFKEEPKLQELHDFFQKGGQIT